MHIEFPSNDPEQRHRCRSRREGDWAVFFCPFCPGFERRINLRTGAMKTSQPTESFVLHEGFYLPAGLEHTHSLSN